MLNIRDIATLDRGHRATLDLIDACRIRGPLSDLDRRLVADVSRKAKWLRAALDKLSATTPVNGHGPKPAA